LDASGVASPKPLTMTLPPEPPRSVRGKRLEVRMLISEQGQVLPGHTVVIGSDEEAFNQRLIELSGRWTFHPGMYQGCAATLPYSWILQL